MVGEADRELTCVSFTFHSNDPIYEFLRYIIMVFQYQGIFKSIKQTDMVGVYLFDVNLDKVRKRYTKDVKSYRLIRESLSPIE